MFFFLPISVHTKENLTLVNYILLFSNTFQQTFVRTRKKQTRFMRGRKIDYRFAATISDAKLNEYIIR